MIDNEIKDLEYVRYHLTASAHKKAIDDAIDLINRLQAEKEALIAGQETMSKYIEEQQAEIENQSQNFKVLVSDHRCLQQAFDNLKSLYQAEKEKVESAKSKSIYFAKELQKARAEINRVTALAAEWKDAAYTYADNIDKIKAEAIKEFAERLKSRLITVTYMNFDDTIDNLVKEMVGDNNAE